ncbi:MAG: IclR family transcriptional regulator [Actinomycetota bacterium]|nr:IclR family transcriptional regulator [Actinomycetota bacterium]
MSAQANKAKVSSVSSPTGGTGTEAADRVADVLMLFAGGPASVGVSEIARQLELSKAVVHRILQSLVSRSFVTVNPDTREYRLGPAALALGARALRDVDLRRAARPVLRRLRDDTEETATLSELVEDRRVYLDQIESRQEVKMTVELGRPHPLHAGASSRVILAYLPPERVEQIIDGGLPALTSDTITSVHALRRELAEARRRGYATSRNERQSGAASVAAPVFNVEGEVVGSLSVCGPVSRFDDATSARCAPLVKAAAEEVSRALGWDEADDAAGA